MKIEVNTGRAARFAQAPKGSQEMGFWGRVLGESNALILFAILIVGAAAYFLVYGYGGDDGDGE